MEMLHPLFLCNQLVSNGGGFIQGQFGIGLTTAGFIVTASTIRGLSLELENQNELVY